MTATLRPINVLALAGSLRRDSYNRRLLDAAARQAPVGARVTVYDQLASVPLFDEDLDAATGGGPPGVQRLRAAVAACDGLLIATPEYNQSVPGVLKNAIDWLSLRRPEAVLRGKPVALMGATTGSWGTRLAQRRDKMDRELYLRRIGFAGRVAPDAETLRRLHRRHLLRVPFENLDIHLGRPLSLAPPALFDKIVSRRRGGFCYELNGLFAWLLRDLGFAVDLLAGRVAGENGRPGPEFDHLALLVRLQEPWLADVGFGDNFLEPLRLASSEPQLEGDVAYRVVRHDSSLLALERRDPGQPWSPQYFFDTKPHQLGDYEERCRYHQSSPDSHFTQKRLCTLATPEGRVTLTGLRLVETAGDARRETELAGEGRWRATLEERFGIELG